MAIQQPDIYDVVIVGLGPAAVTAAIYSYRKRVKTLLIGKDFGGAVLISGEIENWPGEIHTDGIALSEKFEQHIRKYCTDVSCFDQSLVTKIEREGKLFRVHNEHGKSTLTRTVIYASGRTPRKLGIPGEKEYTNKGVTYCAVCDGPLFGGKAVAVIGGGNSALEAILMLTRIASHVTAVNKNPAYKGDEIYIQQLAQLPNVTVAYNGRTKEVKGDGKFAQSVVVEDTQTGKVTEYPAKGVFVEIGSMPIIEPVLDLGLALTAYKEIQTGRNGETNIPGFFAAGDITDIRDKQIVVAAGMGCAAALSAGEYLLKQGAP